MQKISGVGARLLRVSTDRQDFDRQIADIERWEREQGVHAKETFTDKESRLLAEKRDEFQKLLVKVDNRLVNWVVIQSTDRLGFKHSYELFETIGRFMRAGASLFTALDGRCLTSTDDASVITNAIHGQTSQKEILEKSNRVQGKRILKGSAGEFAGGMPPYGFDVLCRDAAGNVKWRFVQTGRRRGRWIKERIEEAVTSLPPHDRKAKETLWLAPSIVEERVQTVRRIFDLFDGEATSTLQIARRLNAEHVSPVLSDRWQHSKVWALLQNCAVTGRPASNKVTLAKVFSVEGEKLVQRNPDEIGRFERLGREHWLRPEKELFEPLVPEDQFWRCCSKLWQSPGTRAPKNENLILSGLLYCGTCGQKMSGQYKQKTSGGKKKPGFYHYYRCQSYMNEKDKNPYGCRNHGTLQETVMPHVEEFLSSRGQAISDLMSQHRDRVSLLALIKERRQHDEEIRSIVGRMRDFLSDALTGSGVEVPRYSADFADPTADDGHNAPYIVDLYDQVFTVRRRELEAEIADLEGQHSQMTTQFFKLPPKAQEKALKLLHSLESRIAEAKANLEPLADRWQDLLVGLDSLKERLAEARLALAKGSLRQQAQALRNALERIEVHYRPKGAKHSELVLVRIVPLIGTPQDYAVPGEGNTAASRCRAGAPRARRSARRAAPDRA